MEILQIEQVDLFCRILRMEYPVPGSQGKTMIKLGDRIMYSRVCKVNEISVEGEMYRFDVNDRPLLVTRLGDEYYATDSICTHEEADLSLGILSQDVVTCPLHQARFELKTGKVLSGPDGSDPDSLPALRIYQTKVENGELLIEI
ncbi:MAG: Rieske (2Fe-2S) protein [Nitrososphaerales archaeon]